LSGNAQAERQFLPLFLARLFHNGQPSGQAAERELMNHMKIVHNQRGQGLTEYIVLLMLVSVISISAVSLLGRTVKGKIEEANKAINSKVTDGGDGGGGGAGTGAGAPGKAAQIGGKIGSVVDILKGD
jgi:Flp pilus assembly pilin Flp